MPEICESIEMSFLRCFLVVLNRIFNLFTTILVSLLKKLGWIHQSFLKEFGDLIHPLGILHRGRFDEVLAGFVQISTHIFTLLVQAAQYVTDQRIYFELGLCLHLLSSLRLVYLWNCEVHLYRLAYILRSSEANQSLMCFP